MDVDDRLEAEWVAGVVARLPDRQRVVLHYRAAGYGVDEIAEKLNLNYKTVESLMSRGRATVRKALAATLSLLGLVTFAGRRKPVMTLPMVGVVVAAVTVWVLPGHNYSPQKDPATTIRQQAASSRLAHDETAGGPILSATPAKRSTDKPSSHVRRVTHIVTHIVVPGVLGPVTHGGLSVSNSHPEESMLDSTLRCIRNGLAAELSNIGCR